jgi:hypothetical protein
LNKGTRLERNCGIQTVGIEDCKRNIIEYKSQVLKIFENYITVLYNQPNRRENLKVKPEEEVRTDYFMQREVENAIKEMRDKKATGYDDVPGDVLKLLEEDGIRIMTQVINNIYETGNWPKDLIEVTMIPLQKQPKATKCSDHHTVSPIAHTAKVVAGLLRRIERKTEKVLGEDQFGFRRGKGTRAAIGMLRIMSQRTLNLDEEFCLCFIDWQTAFDHVNWTKLMQVL